ncbi:hypothetical protein ACFL5Q_06995, partial [Planctomycetota bacterium]
YPTFSAVGLDGPMSLVVSLRVVNDSAAADQDTATVWIAEPLGPADFLELNDLDPFLGDLWYSLETTHDGFLTIVSLNLGGTVTLYDENANPLPPGASQRVDWQVADGERYYFTLSRFGSNVDLRLANLVSQAVTNVTVYGADAAVLNGNNQNETVELWPGHGTLTGEDYSVAIWSVETVTAAGGGTDVAFLHDNPELKETFDSPVHIGQGFLRGRQLGWKLVLLGRPGLRWTTFFGHRCRSIAAFFSAILAPYTVRLF